MWFPLKALEESWSRSSHSELKSVLFQTEITRLEKIYYYRHFNSQILLIKKKKKPQRSHFFLPLKYAGGASVIGKEMDCCVMMSFRHHMTERLLSEVLLQWAPVVVVHNLFAEASTAHVWKSLCFLWTEKNPLTFFYEVSGTFFFFQQEFTTRGGQKNKVALLY